MNQEGGSQSRPLMTESTRMLNWAEKHTLSLKTEHISGATNIRADWLSRTQTDQGEWLLYPSLFQELLRFGHPIVDLFAHLLNAQLLRFFSWLPCPGAEGCNALRSAWPPGLLYAFPPLPLISKVIRKILTENVELLLVALYWLRRPWYADLMNLSVESPWRIPRERISYLRQNSSEGPWITDINTSSHGERPSNEVSASKQFRLESTKDPTTKLR